LRIEPKLISFGNVLKILTLAVLATTGLPSIAPAHHRHHSNDAPSGVFDYYVLSLSWSPAFCLQSPAAAECNGPRREVRVCFDRELNPRACSADAVRESCRAASLIVPPIR
jgi:ribonuclease I